MNAKILDTPSGPIRFPAYVPVTTFGGKYPLDGLIQPYLPRLAPALMVSHHYARQMREKPRLPVMIDSGGFAALFEGSKVLARKGLGILEIHLGEEPELLTPWDVLEFQEQHADIAFTLDFPIPPNLPIRDARRRQKLTIANACWALENRRRREMRLFACIQAWDSESARDCARQLAERPFDGFAIGGLVPRAWDWELLSSIVLSVRNEVGSRPLHIFGLGKPELAAKLFELGVDSVDSSSYVKAAADGVSWATGSKVPDPSVSDRLALALSNLALATGSTLPLSVGKLFPTRC
ncbi:queuine tRNA-ribosyltransferase family protein [Luteolibacter flavescens]|uniref:Queuine tRNA-ribosyltransferase family protein n=1 Tax=Luteolibacter flavescens TaxID=1859460 RepID=A0ABT3FT05_9BACT|nr:queuine tRNA-ribosyltransferase family protein [Luteolibacter flavescens]MCW1886715.1 queuine tRNA-ribosyltransferase family protein [Luteolibacter flavescens]